MRLKLLALLLLPLSAAADGNYRTYTVPPLPGAQVQIGTQGVGVGVSIPQGGTSMLPSVITTTTGTYIVVPNYSTGAVQAVIQVAGPQK